MRHVIGNRVPQGAARGALAGCGCSGAKANPVGGAGWKKSYSSSYGNPAPRRRPKTISPNIIDPFSKAPICYQGTNGQLVCPQKITARPGRSMARDYIGSSSFRLPGGQACFFYDGQWHCESH